MNAIRSRKVFRIPTRIFLLFLGILGPWMLTGCPPTPRCDEKVSDPQIVQNAIQSNLEIKALNSELSQRNLTIGNCFVDGRVSVVVQYQLPPSYSQYQVSYADQISIAYSKDGSLDLINAATPPTTLQADSVLDYFMGRIRELESDPRVREVLTNTDPDPLNPVVPLFGQEPVLRSDENRVEYNFFYHLVRGYVLTNQMDWQEFPEIQLAHQLIREYLLVGDLGSCTIGKGDMHAYTMAQFHDAPESPWNMTVALLCADGWKDAFVQINRDGSYDRLSIITNYDNK